MTKHVVVIASGETERRSLPHLLLADRTYTAVISEEIARCLSPPTVARHSPSFNGLLGAVRNGRGAKTRSNPTAPSDE
jgi:hypothetical protein